MERNKKWIKNQRRELEKRKREEGEGEVQEEEKDEEEEEKEEEDDDHSLYYVCLYLRFCDYLKTLSSSYQLTS